MKIKEIPLTQIIPYEKNARINAEAIPKVAASLKEYGWQQPIVVDKNMVIIAGHTRLEAAKLLGWQTAPVVVADNLTDAQVKAYRLVDNKSAEYSEWDADLLGDELTELLDMDIDMSEWFDLADERKDDDEGYFGDERERTADAYNLHDVDASMLSKKWQMPIIKKCNHIPLDIISFNYAKTSTEYGKGIHFYIDDYQFERIWNNPHEYMPILKKFDCVLTPDFSLYTEMPLPMQIWNIYRSKMIGQIMQRYGIKVIPTLQWCRENSFTFAFDGIEPGGTVSVSTIGVKKTEEAHKLWVAGMDKAIKELRPAAVVVYGGDIGYDFGKTKVIYIANHNAEKISKSDSKNEEKEV